MSKGFRFIALFLCSILLHSMASMAQTPVELHITHKLGTADFAFNTATTNNLGHSFNLSRVQYYISQISITHDGGTITEVPGHYILANANANIISHLGSYSITNVEGVTFYIGVDTPANHADPSLQPADHPLAHQTPVMHWGWASGYRFAAVEGKCGASLDKNFEVHALGDNNYGHTSITVTGTLVDGKIIIPLYADYSQLLNDIDATATMIVHGETDQSVTLLRNIRTFVFAPGTPVTTGTDNINTPATAVRIFPNPSPDGSITIGFDNAQPQCHILVSDILGRHITAVHKAANQTSVKLQLPGNGLYMMQVQNQDGSTAVYKLQTL